MRVPQQLPPRLWRHFRFHATAASQIDCRPDLADFDRIRKRTEEPEQPQLTLQKGERRRPRSEDPQCVRGVDGYVAQHLQSRTIAELLAGEYQIELRSFQQSDGIDLGRSCLDRQVVSKRAGSPGQCFRVPTCNE
jgi:hypothetical protein